MNIEDIIGYVDKTPCNSNPNVLSGMLEELKTESETVTITLKNESGVTIDKVYVDYLDENHNWHGNYDMSFDDSFKVIKDSAIRVTVDDPHTGDSFTWGPAALSLWSDFATSSWTEVFWAAQDMDLIFSKMV